MDERRDAQRGGVGGADDEPVGRHGGDRHDGGAGDLAGCWHAHAPPLGTHDGVHPAGARGTGTDAEPDRRRCSALVGEAGLDALDTRLASGAITVADYEARKQELAAIVLESDEYREAMNRAEDVAARREGFFFEVAAGFVWDFAGASWESRTFRQRGVWATPSYEFGAWSLVGVLRYLDETGAFDQDALDWGGRALYSTADYALSLEFVQRLPIEQTDAIERSHRFVGIAEYRVSRASWVIASFGKDRQKTGARETLIAQLWTRVQLQQAPLLLRTGRELTGAEALHERGDRRDRGGRWSRVLLD